MKRFELILIPPACTAEESLRHWRDFFVLAGVSVIGVFTVPDIATNPLSGAVSVANVCATWLAAAWATIASLRRIPSTSAGGPPNTAVLRLTRAWLAHMASRIRSVSERFRGAGAFPRDA